MENEGQLTGSIITILYFCCVSRAAPRQLPLSGNSIDCRYQWLNATHEVTLKIPFHRAEEKRHGFILAIIPKVNKPKQEIAGMEIIAVERVEDAVAKMR